MIEELNVNSILLGLLSLNGLEHQNELRFTKKAAPNIHSGMDPPGLVFEMVKNAVKQEFPVGETLPRFNFKEVVG